MIECMLREVHVQVVEEPARHEAQIESEAVLNVLIQHELRCIYNRFSVEVPQDVVAGLLQHPGR